MKFLSSLLFVLMAACGVAAPGDDVFPRRKAGGGNVENLVTPVPGKGLAYGADGKVKVVAVPSTTVETVAEFQAALLVGGDIQVKYGTYNLATYLDVALGSRIHGIPGPSGELPKLIINNAVTNTHVFVIRADDVEIDHLDISGAQVFPTVSNPPVSYTQGNHSGIALVRVVSGQKCQRLYVHDCRIHHLWIGFYNPGGATAGWIDDVRFERNYCHTFSHTGFYSTWNLRGWRVINNHFDWKRTGVDTHVAHPDYSTTAGNCVYIGATNTSSSVVDAQVNGNFLENSVYRWLVEFFYVADSQCVGNYLSNGADGISMTGVLGDSNNIVDGNVLREITTPPAHQVGAIELVGPNIQCHNNRIISTSVVTICGIAVNSESTKVSVVGNWIKGCANGVQAYASGSEAASDSLFAHNVIDSALFGGGLADRGIFFNSGGPDFLRNMVVDNVFVGQFGSACVHLMESPSAVVKRNIQYAADLGGESTTSNNLIYCGTAGSSAHVDDSGTAAVGTGGGGVGFTRNGSNGRFHPTSGAFLSGGSWVDLSQIRSSSGDQVATSGTYTPTLTNVTNVAASVAFECQYTRIGNTVTVSGQVSVDPTAASATELGLSVPVASNFGAVEDLGGTGVAAAVAGHSAAISADVANDRASLQLTPIDVANQTLSFQFTYQVIP